LIRQENVNTWKVDEIMTKKLTCQHCGCRFNPPARGRKPRYCSPSHRQLAYEKRKAEVHGHAKKLLKYDLSTIQGEDLARRFVLGILKEVGLLKTGGRVPRVLPGPEPSRSTSNELLKRTLAKKAPGGDA
jgi:hypothetical protein